MYYQITCETSDYLENFIQFLIKNMQLYAKDNNIYDKLKTLIWNDYFNSNVIFNKKPTVKLILIGFTKNLTYRLDYEGYSIYCDDSQKFENTEYNYYLLAAIINYGTLDCKAYLIVDLMFEYFNNELLSLYELWRLTNNVNKTV